MMKTELFVELKKNDLTFCNMVNDTECSNLVVREFIEHYKENYINKDEVILKCLGIKHITIKTIHWLFRKLLSKEIKSFKITINYKV